MFTLQGFSIVRREGLELTGSRVVNVDAQMVVGGLQETVTVTGETPVVDIQSSQREQVMNDELIAALPAGRSHYDLAALLPGLNGVQFGRAGWQDVGGTNNLQIAAMSIHGGSFLDTKVAVNGLSSRNLLSSSWASNFIADTGTAAEWTISYAGQGAEANSSGVTFDMIPKEGGNRFSGAIFATGANEDFQASNYTPELAAQGLRAAGGLYRMYDINPSGGGPILTNKLWFYASGRWQTNQFYIPGSVGNANAGEANQWLWAPDDGTPRQVQHDAEQRERPAHLPGQPGAQVLVLARAAEPPLDRRARGNLARGVHRLPVPHPAVHLGRLVGAAHQQAARDRQVGGSWRRASAIASRRTRRTTR